MFLAAKTESQETGIWRVNSESMSEAAGKSVSNWSDWHLKENSTEERFPGFVLLFNNV